VICRLVLLFLVIAVGHCTDNYLGICEEVQMVDVALGIFGKKDPLK